MFFRPTFISVIVIPCILVSALAQDSNPQFPEEPLPVKNNIAAACPGYASYSVNFHSPFSDGPAHLSFQRPAIQCRTFLSPVVELVIDQITTGMKDRDLARIFENAFPNTLDTTIKWHDNGSTVKSKMTHDPFLSLQSDEGWEGPQSFIVTGDINAEWLRDATNQLAQYQFLAKKDKAIEKLILGAINTQSEYVIKSPYCNAFQPPARSHLPPTYQGQDVVRPIYDPTLVFECKYELDSLAHFLSLGNQFYSHTGNSEFMNEKWFKALWSLLVVLKEQEKPTFDPETGFFTPNPYNFRRSTTTSTEALNLRGMGSPLNGGTGLVRSAFRPSDDATILGFLIPANAMMSVELKRTGEILKKIGVTQIGENLMKRATLMEEGIWEHGVVHHKKYGNVFAFEIDGYGSSIMMDDANLPSLLSLPLLGFVDKSDPTYQNTRRMVLDKIGNPYYIKGYGFEGIGSPHVGLLNAWPMSLLVQAMTSDDDDEILQALDLVKKASGLGLVHESVDVNLPENFTRSWFAWANSVFAQTILDLAMRKPELLYGKGAKPFVMQ